MYYYNTVRDSEGIWLVENSYNQRYCRKSESVYTISNGYVGIRGAHDFKGLVESRGMFISGFYHKATPEEVIELVNCPDITMNEILIDGQLLSLDSAVMEAYERRFNTDTAELRFNAVLEIASGQKFRVSSRRFASIADRRIVCQSLQLELIGGGDVSISIKTGVNGQVSNSGASHISRTECRVIGNRYMDFTGYAEPYGVEIMEDVSVDFPGKSTENFGLERRSIYKTAKGVMRVGDVMTIDKVIALRLVEGSPECVATTDICDEIVGNRCYEELFRKHTASLKLFWQDAAIRIDGISDEDSAALKYAQLQLYCMTPADGGASSIAAKGLTGEGYKGHVFWDTELYMLPFYIHTFPEIAKSLLIYRYHGLEGAREKAREYGYCGAMYPWESARDGREETPLFSALNIHTGKATPVWSGRKEHHVTADIGYAIISYYQSTGDWDFIMKYGLEMLTEISLFWASRAVERNGRLEILDTIGPDEYTEHIDNNAFTNHMAKYVVNVTINLMAMGHAEQHDIIDDYDSKVAIFRDFVDRIYLPEPNETGIIPQDDTFLSKPALEDISEFKGSPIKQAVLLKHSRDEVVDSQVLKQADVVMLLNLFPRLVDREILKKNVEYYEDRTLHDSSLSYCAHAQACANVGLTDLAMQFFRKALEVDLCANPMDSTDGLHAASLGGIWNCVINGFAGLSSQDGELSLNPHLPESWRGIAFTTMFNGQKYRVNITQSNSEIVPVME